MALKKLPKQACLFPYLILLIALLLYLKPLKGGWLKYRLVIDIILIKINILMLSLVEGILPIKMTEPLIFVWEFAGALGHKIECHI